MVKIQNSPYLPELRDKQVSDGLSKDVRQANLTIQGLSFQDIFKEKTLENNPELKFSKHAAGRLSDRNIRLTQEQMERLSDGTQKAGEKGIKESLVIVDQLAFIVNIQNNTVVTAMDQRETQENVFTNIDGAVIM